MSARQTSLSASSADPHMRPSQPNLRITVIKAESLHKRNIFRQPDPFVVITVDGEQTKTSPVVKGSLSPFWNFTIDVFAHEASVISVQVFDQKLFKEEGGNQGFLGVVNILVKAFINLSAISSNVFRLDLRPSTGKSVVKGSITVAMTTDLGYGQMNSQTAAVRTSPPATQQQVQQPFQNIRPVGVPPSIPPSVKYQPGSPYVDEFGPLPPGWERRFDSQGRKFYIDNNTRTTSWTRPQSSAVTATSLQAGMAPGGTLEQQRAAFEQRQAAMGRLAPTTGPVSSTQQPQMEDLPAGWERRIAPNGQPYFVDHNTQRTTWVHPNRIQQVRLPPAIQTTTATGGHQQLERIYQQSIQQLGPLPTGWEMRLHTDGRIYFADHNTHSTAWDDPRLPSTVMGDDVPQYKQDYQRKLVVFRSQPDFKLRDPGEDTKITVGRDTIFADAFTALSALPANALKRKLTITFANEPGLDYGGVSREFFFLLSHELFNPLYGLFQYSSHENYTLQINPHSSVNPDHLDYFRFSGRVIGMAVFHKKFFDAYFVSSFYKQILDQRVTLEDIESIDAEVYRGLQWLKENDVSDLGNTFSVDDERFGERIQVDLIPNGSQIDVTNENKHEYVDLLVQWRAVTRIREQMDALKAGFFEMVPRPLLISTFDHGDLEFLISGVSEIDVADWKANTIYRNYTASSQIIQWFWKCIEEDFDNVRRASLLQFATGTSRIPLNGFRDLQGSDGPRKFTIEMVEDTKMLPRSHTCFNRIDLPPYPSYEILVARLTMAIECSEGFGDQ